MNRQTCTAIALAAIALAAIALAVTACASGSPSATTAANAPAASSPAAAAAAQPLTEAGVRGAANDFYALYSAGQWDAAWAYLTPATKAAVPEATFAAFHEGCPSPTAGMARVIKAVTLAGPTAVVTETVAGAAGAIGSITDAWKYASGRWGFQPEASALGVYKHGSIAADIASAKAAGSCAKS